MQAIISTLQNVIIALFGGTLGDETVTGAIPTFWNWLTQPEVIPYLLIGIAVSLLLLGVKLVRGIFWGL